jgi:hypothetical protein
MENKTNKMIYYKAILPFKRTPVTGYVHLNALLAQQVMFSTVYEIVTKPDVAKTKASDVWLQQFLNVRSTVSTGNSNIFRIYNSKHAWLTARLTLKTESGLRAPENMLLDNFVNCILHQIRSNRVNIFIQSHPAVFTITEIHRKYTVKHNPFMPYSTVLHGSDEPKHAAQCCLALKSCVCQYTSFVFQLEWSIKNSMRRVRYVARTGHWINSYIVPVRKRDEK